MAIKRFPPGTSNRWKVIADFVGRNQKDVIAKAKELQEKKQSDVESKRQQEEELRQKREQLKKEAQEKIKKEAAAKAAKPNQNGTSAQAGKADQKAEQAADVWTNEQQKQMEKGMKEVPASVPTKERWIKIAEGVDGKTPKECFTRFKELCAKAKAASGK